MKDKRELPDGWELVELRESPKRRGYGPHGRGLSPVEKLTFAAMELLYRDDDLVDHVSRLAAGRPVCIGLAPERPTRFVVEHVSSGEHATGPCRDWVDEALALCHALGCPDLDAMLSQVVLAKGGVRPGRMRATRLRTHPGPGRVAAGSPRRPTGTFNRPARDLLARRAHGIGGLEALRQRISASRRAHGLADPGPTTWAPADPSAGWNSLARELQSEEEGWRRGLHPSRGEISYPMWLEWSRRKDRAERIRSADDEVGRHLQRQASKIDGILEVVLPSLV